MNLLSSSELRRTVYERLNNVKTEIKKENLQQAKIELKIILDHVITSINDENKKQKSS